MRAVVCRELGTPDVLRVEERPSPAPGPGQVLVDVEACGVNFVDALFVSGGYQIKPPLPFVPGSEVAGTVVAVGGGGDAADGISVGDRVLAMPGLGGWAEQVVLGAGQVARVPDGLDAPTAATFVQSYSTALFTLTRRMSVEPGEVLLVLGAGGGVGLATVDVGRALGLTVVAAASSAAKRDAASAMGAVAVIDTSSEDLKARARELGGTGPRGTDPPGVDVVVDPVGGELTEQALRALRPGGRLAVIGFAAGSIPALPANQVLLNNRTVVGVDWRAWGMRNPGLQQDLLREALGMVESGALRPTSPRTLPLEQAARALEELTGREVTGKLALTTT